jgi:hypothetical protein
MALRRPGTQFGIWAGLLVAGTLCLFFGQTLIALLFLVCAQLFPKDRRKNPPSPEGELKSIPPD